MQNDTLQRFQSALPQVRQWIEEYLDSHAAQARSVSSLNFNRLADWFPLELLEGTKVVTVNKVQFPPIDKFRLPELAYLQQKTFAGVTFNDTFFVQQDSADNESLHFHELVHVAQWSTLGIDNFLLAYGSGLIQKGYPESPLEEMAYALQRRFDADESPQKIVGLIQRDTATIWDQITGVAKSHGLSGKA